MKRAPRLDYESLRLEGALLSPTLLDKVRHLTLPHQQPSDYGIEKGLTIKDELGRYWRIAQARWEAFEQGRHRQDIDLHRFTLDEWLLPLLETVLGYQVRVNTQPLNKGERRFPITHLACEDAVPLVLAAPDQDLDKGDVRFGEEGRRRSPQGLAQEYLNAEQDALWALVSNGRVLRLLRDNPAMTRPAYLEVDFQRLFDEDNFADFSLFWLLLHHSRLMPGDGRPEGAILEQWREQGQQEGERALGELRVGVTQALRELGSGFLAHPDNDELRQALEQGELGPQGYFQELLRLVYRFLFLLTAEDRDLVLLPEADEVTRELYRRGYSLGHLRERARYRRHHDRYDDAWEQLRITFEGFRHGQPLLGQPVLGGLFAANQCPHLDDARLGNRFLYKALFHLGWFRSSHGLVRINYRDMDTEELGSVYESLLELVPVVQVGRRPWRFAFLGDPEPGSEPAQDRQRGSARKTTGSYYTPDSLVQELIHSALEPVIERTLKENREQPVEALLSLKIVDPAAGSGHFLLAAARRLAAEVARLRAGADQATESDYRHALREVVAHCIYGVDLNPLAVELCKTALWLETVEPGKPLGFLDAHIRCGNALVGVLDPKILTEGIPDDAYKLLTGDDKRAATQLKKANKAAREGGVMSLDFGRAVAEPSLCAVDLDRMPEDTPEQVEAKRRAWETARQSYACRHQREAADLFVAAFFAPKRPETIDAVPTSEDLIAWREGRAVRRQVAAQTEELARRHRFFHWYIEFPEVFERGGFDCVLGNPPWERIKLQEKEFFASRAPDIAAAPNAAARRRMIEGLNEPPQDVPEGVRQAMRRLYRKFQQARQTAEAASQFVRTGGRFPLTGVGDVNLYAVFAESFLNLMGAGGRAGLICPTGIATDDSTKVYFEHITSRHHLAALYDFENREKLFPAVDSRMKFALLTLGSDCPEADFLFFATRVEHLRDPRRHFQLSAADIHLLNPNTHTCPVFRSRRDAELTRKIYRQVPVLSDESRGAAGNPWGIRFNAMFHMSNDSGLFRTREQLLEEGATGQRSNWLLPDGTVYVPLYEAKMVHQFDHRWAEYEEDGKTTRDLTDEDHADPQRAARPRYWVPRDEVEARLAARDWHRGWLLGWRDICRSTDERTVIAGVVPRVGVGNNFPLMFPNKQIEPKLLAALVGNLSALAFDFVARHKVGGTHLNFFIIKQLPVLPPGAYTPADLEFIVPRVLELTYTAEDLRPWAEDLGYTGDPFPWNPDRRRLRAELDAWYGRLYGLSRDELRYILDPADVGGEDHPSETFRVLKKKDLETFGEYLTRRLVLEAWDALEE